MPQARILKQAFNADCRLPPSEKVSWHAKLGELLHARVADLSHVSSHDQAFLEGSGLSSQRGSSSSSFNLHGQLLIDLCHGTSLMLGTGRLAGDLHACATHRSGSRLDHFLMDRYTLTRVAASSVVADRFDSDHKPVTVEFHVAASPAAASASIADSPVGPSAHPLSRLQWDGARQEVYAEQLKGLRPSLRECHASIRRGQLQHAFQQLGDIIQQAAISAGCRHVPTSKRPRGKVKDSPYFDDECRRMRAQFRHAARHDPDSVRVLAHRFTYAVCKKCRQYRQQQTPRLLRDLRSNHKCFWTR